MSETETRRSAYPDRLVTAACAAGLLGLAVSTVHLVACTPLTFTLFMFVGQPTFAAAMAMYLTAVLVDLRRRRVL